MATKDFTAKQKEILARKMGYDGPMQGFDEYLKSDPALARKYGAVLDKYMARGGMAKKYADGGLAFNVSADSSAKEKSKEYARLLSEGYSNNQIRAAAEAKFGKQTDADWSYLTGQATNTKSKSDFNNSDGKVYEPGSLISDPINTDKNKDISLPGADGVTFNVNKGSSEQEKIQEYANLLKQGYSNEQIRSAAEASFGTQTDADWSYLTTKAAESLAQGKPAGQDFKNEPIKISESGKPVAPTAQNITAVQADISPEEIISSAGAPSDAMQVTAQQAGPAVQAAAPEKKEFEEITATKVAEDTAKALEKVQPAQGTVSEEAQVTAQTMEPTATALAKAQAEQGVATKVEAPAARKVEEGELVSGTAVDQARIAAELAKTEAAQGQVTEEMTVQGQLNKLLADFDAKNPPPWAAGSMRAVTAVLAERGLGASSLAGQAIIQATLESALPIATADAATYREMEAQNLSNRQQTAMLLAQQRAQFLGQEFDQNFQTKVLNAAKIADIANMNFSAQTQIALENARLAQTMDLANLSNKQAVLMANVAQIANLELTNLNNRQQAAVLNAQAFLQMDMQNLANEQQTEMFKAQSVIQSLFTDAAAENAAKQFNSASKLQNDQFFAGLTAQVAQFNAEQQNAMAQFNVSQANAIAQFNTQQQNLRDQFNAENQRIIDQSNAEWRRQITLTNTQNAQRTAELNAQNALEMTKLEYNNEWQAYRDDIEMAWKTADNQADRDNQIALQVISKEAQIEAAKMQADALKYQAAGQAAAVLLGKTSLGDVAVGGVTKLIDKLTGGDTDTSWLDELLNNPGDISGSDTTELDELLNEFGTVKNEDTGITIEDVENELYGGG